MKTEALGVLDDADLNESLTGATSELEFSKKTSEVTKKLTLLNISSTAGLIASGMALRVDKQNKQNTINNYKNALSVNLEGLLGGKAVTDKLRLAIENNVNLIQSLRIGFINELGKAFERNLFSTDNKESIRKMIRAQTEVSKSRADFIARDQTSKLNGSLTKVRAENLGIDFYRWEGSGDERQRDDHSALNGMLCKYSDKEVYSPDDGKTWANRSEIDAVALHPSEDYNCRCLGNSEINLNEQD